MAHFRIADAEGEIRVGQEDGTTTTWQRPTWAQRLKVTVHRLPNHLLEVTVRVEGNAPSSPRMKAGTLKKGEALSLKVGVELPVHFFKGSGVALRFIADE